jgi:hypothetical protein
LRLHVLPVLLIVLAETIHQSRFLDQRCGDGIADDLDITATAVNPLTIDITSLLIE